MNDVLHLERSPITGDLELIRPREYTASHLFQFVFSTGSIGWNLLSPSEREEFQFFIRRLYDNTTNERGMRVARHTLGNMLIGLHAEGKPFRGEISR